MDANLFMIGIVSVICGYDVIVLLCRLDVHVSPDPGVAQGFDGVAARGVGGAAVAGVDGAVRGLKYTDYFIFMVCIRINLSFSYSALGIVSWSGIFQNVKLLRKNSQLFQYFSC